MTTDGTHYVYLKLGSYDSDNLGINTVALKAESISVSTTKTVPSFDVPLSGMFSGESRTVALNLGMASKTVSVTGIIVDQTIKRKFDDTGPEFYDASENTPTASRAAGTFAESNMNPQLVDEVLTIDMTKEEVAQLIHSNTDGTTFQDMQNMNELIFLMDSKVNSRYQYRNSDRSSNLIPFTYAARGYDNTLDNQGAILLVTDFPDSQTATGLKGFVRSFSTDFAAADPSSISFSLEFEIAFTV